MINGQTALFGIIGNPIKHSLSPILHNGAFRRMGLNAVYLAFKVRDLEDALRGIRSLGIQGVSVTLPFKTEVIPFLDDVEEMAGEIKAVNTIVNRKGRMIGYNTDWNGALEALEARVDLSGKRVFLLGAGGAARAIAFSLKGRGCRVTLSNRTEKKGKLLANELGFLYRPWSSVDELEEDILINATSVGMSPNDGESPVPKRVLNEGMSVMDIVYQPLRTKLLREAEERGCLTINGLEMLCRQGVAQLEIWTGRKPDIGQVKEDLYKALAIGIDRKENDRD